jgi:hypothetical protein
LHGLEADALTGVWQAVERRLGEALERGTEIAVPGLRMMAERFLLGRGLAVDEPSLEMFCDEIVKAIRDAAKTNARKAGGLQRGRPSGKTLRRALVDHGRRWAGGGSPKPPSRAGRAVT